MPPKSSSRIPWRVKLEHPGVKLPKIVAVPRKWQKQYGTGRMLIAHPLEVNALVRRVRKGKLITQTQLRECLARDHRADVTCPLTTGIFLRIIAEVAEEERRAGRKRIAPYWRVVREDGSMNEKFPGGVIEQARHLLDEGFSIVVGKGRKLRVGNFERHLARL